MIQLTFIFYIVSNNTALPGGKIQVQISKKWLDTYRAFELQCLQESGKSETKDIEDVDFIYKEL